MPLHELEKKRSSTSKAFHSRDKGLYLSSENALRKSFIAKRWRGV